MNSSAIVGKAAPLPISNLDTDQIMPKQFLRGIDKSGLAGGLFYDLRFDGEGRPREQCVLNRAEYRDCRILIGGPNFGCGSSREHAVWGLLQFGIRAVIAPSFGDIFYSNAVNNRLLAAVVRPADWERLLSDMEDQCINLLTIDVERLTVSSSRCTVGFELPARYRQMFLEGVDLLTTTLAAHGRIAEFQHIHWGRNPWLQCVAGKTRVR